MHQMVTRIRLLATYLALLLPFIAYGAFHSLQSSNNSPIDWVDSSFSERKHYDEFVELFGPGDAVIASWPGCDWSDARLDRLVRGLRESKVFRAADGTPLFHAVHCGRETLQSMVKRDETSLSRPSAVDSPDVADGRQSSEPAVSDDQGRMSLVNAIQRLQGTMIGTDGRTTCVVATLNSAGLARRESVVENLRRAIRVCCSVADDDLHLAGPVIDGLTTDQASHRSLTNFAGPSALIMFVICWWSLRSLFSALSCFWLPASARQCCWQSSFIQGKN